MHIIFLNKDTISRKSKDRQKIPKEMNKKTKMNYETLHSLKCYYEPD